jgi:hypothetical protein
VQVSEPQPEQLAWLTSLVQLLQPTAVKVALACVQLELTVIVTVTVLFGQESSGRKVNVSTPAPYVAGKFARLLHPQTSLASPLPGTGPDVELTTYCPGAVCVISIIEWTLPLPQDDAEPVSQSQVPNGDGQGKPAPAASTPTGAPASKLPGWLTTDDHGPHVGMLSVFVSHAVLTATPVALPAVIASHTAAGNAIRPLCSFQPLSLSASKGTRQASGPQIPLPPAGSTIATFVPVPALKGLSMEHVPVSTCTLTPDAKQRTVSKHLPSPFSVPPPKTSPGW